MQNVINIYSMSKVSETITFITIMFFFFKLNPWSKNHLAVAIIHPNTISSLLFDTLSCCIMSKLRPQSGNQLHVGTLPHSCRVPLTSAGPSAGLWWSFVTCLPHLWALSVNKTSLDFIYLFISTTFSGEVNV